MALAYFWWKISHLAPFKLVSSTYTAVMASKDILLPLTEGLQNAKIALKLEFIELKQRSIIQGDIFFLQRSQWHHFFDLAAEIYEFIAFLRFLRVSDSPKIGTKLRLAFTYVNFKSHYFQVGEWLFLPGRDILHRWGLLVRHTEKGAYRIWHIS